MPTFREVRKDPDNTKLIELTDLVTKPRQQERYFKTEFLDYVSNCVGVQNSKLATIQNQGSVIGKMTTFQDRISKPANFFDLGTAAPLVSQSKKHWIPIIYWVDFVFFYLASYTRKALKYAGAFLTIPSAYFWDKAYKTITEGPRENDSDGFMSVDGSEQAIRVLIVIGLFIGWLIVGAIPCAIGQMFHLAANALSYVQRLLSGVVELLGALSSPLWIALSQWYHGGPKLKALSSKDFDGWYAAKEIFWNIIFLIPVAIILLISFVPGLGQLAAPALVPFLAPFNAAVQGLITTALFASFAVGAQLVTGTTQAIRNNLPEEVELSCFASCKGDGAAGAAASDNPEPVGMGGAQHQPRYQTGDFGAAAGGGGGHGGGDDYSIDGSNGGRQPYEADDDASANGRDDSMNYHRAPSDSRSQQHGANPYTMSGGGRNSSLAAAAAAAHHKFGNGGGGGGYSSTSFRNGATD